MRLPSPNSTVICREVAEGAVLFSTATEVYFSLNAVGFRIWRLLKDAPDRDSMVATLAEEYPDVSRDVIASDVEDLLGTLANEGLVNEQT